MMPRDDTDSSAAPSLRDAARGLDDAEVCVASVKADDGLDYDALYCERWREKSRYELVCHSIKCDIAEQLTARGRRIRAARYAGAIDRILREVEDTINTNPFGGAA